MFQVSAIREALANHGVVNNTVIHYLSHNADEQADNQPSYQVQQVIDGTLDVAAVWGPMAGYYKTVLHAPLVIKPVNIGEDDVPMEFDMTLAVPRGRPDIKSAIEQALEQHKDEVHRILVDFGVPLVKCDACLRLRRSCPRTDPYKPEDTAPPSRAQIAAEHRARMADLKKWLAQGANPDNELGDAIVANDIDRVRYLLEHGAHVDARDGEGNTPLINATSLQLRRGGDLPRRPQGGRQSRRPQRLDAADVRGVAGQSRSRVDADARMARRSTSCRTTGSRLCAIAAQNAKIKAAGALVAAGADVNAPVAKGGYTPLMLAAISGSTDLTTALFEHGARVNAVNPAA